MKIVTVCGSMRFQKEMIKVAEELESKNGYCVLQPVYNSGGNFLSEDALTRLAKAHYKKIDLSDAIFVVNVGGYIGQSTTEEIRYAEKHGKEIMYLE